MKKKYLLIVGILLLLFVGGYFIVKIEGKQIINIGDINEIKEKKDRNNEIIVDSKSSDNIKFYKSDQLGFTFNLPENWVETNNKGVFITSNSKQLFFKNIENENRLTISYYPAPYGKPHFLDLKEDFLNSRWIYKENKKNLIIAGREALQGIRESTKSSKGILLEEFSYNILVSFEGFEESSSFDIQFQYDKNNESKAIKDLELILDSFKLK